MSLSAGSARESTSSIPTAAASPTTRLSTFLMLTVWWQGRDGPISQARRLGFTDALQKITLQSPLTEMRKTNLAILRNVKCLTVTITKMIIKNRQIDRRVCFYFPNRHNITFKSFEFALLKLR